MEKEGSHLFDVEIAKQLGVNAAVFLQHMKWWIQKNRENKDTQRHYRDGRWWTYNSAKALATIFPYWTPRQIRRIIESLVEEEVILTAKLGGNDRRMWFAFGPKNPFDQTVKWNDSHLTKRSNAFDQTVKSCDQTVKCIRGAVDKPVELPVKKESSQKGLSEEQQEGLELLLRFGVDAKVAHSLILRNHTPVDSICEVIKNGLARQHESGSLWKLEPGYIVAALNAARREGKLIGPTRASKALRKELQLSRTPAMTGA